MTARDEAGYPETTPAKPRTDARILKTRLRLREALVRLTLERGYEAVTIRDLTDAADVGYATYFRHYRDKSELLLDLLEELLAELMALLEPTLSAADTSRDGAIVFGHVKENAALYRVLLAAQRSVTLLPRASEVAMDGLLRKFRPKPDAIVPPEAAVNHLIASFIALVEWWLASGMKQTPDRMGRAFEVLILRPTREAAFEGVPVS
ncbi:MAG TPA: TetR/AcrR family transcriptional regulator [Trueperaceae bacterium]|nr:TetR/AcrR family transcriptional regulator [Trueperaceae bacterium]